MFGLEEYERQDGTIGTTTKLIQFRSLDKLKDIKIPKVKLLDGSTVEYENYKPSSNNNSTDPFGQYNDVVEISENMLD